MSLAEKIEAAKAQVDGLKKQIELEKLKVRRVLKGHFGKVYALHWAGDGRDMISASQDGKLIIWNAQTTMKAHSITLRSSWVMTCAYEPSENEMVACGGLDNLCSIYKLKNNQPQVVRAASELAGHDGYLSCCRFLNPQQIMTCSGDSTCILWDIDRNEATDIFSDHTGDVMSIALHPTSPALFVTASCDSTAKFWDSRQKGPPTMTFSGHDLDVNSCAFFPDGHAFGTGSDDSTCRLFDTRCLMEVNSFHSNSIRCGISSVDFSRSGRLFFAGYDDCNAYVWDVLADESSSTTPQWTLNGHENRVSCLGVSPTGEAVCTGSWDTKLVVWS